ncbi:hypothetical protein MACK_003268 [Theileria orientalis]|uniref:Uncharacterized protein n=1 Tax=Theileria orientalis TaxID=68886 RepID=A0A976SIE2_THEOR|nr:hypothetical protein MACK_003268 [Theileria orientalis]
MILNHLRKNYTNLLIRKSSYRLTQHANHYTKSKYEGTGFRKFLGPFWVYTTPGFLHNYALITGFFVLLYYPLDPVLLNVRKLKAEMDSKVAG